MAKWRPKGCITCNAHQDDIVDIAEYGDDIKRWCCSICDAVWKESPTRDGRLYIIEAEGSLNNSL